METRAPVHGCSQEAHRADRRRPEPPMAAGRQGRETKATKRLARSAIHVCPGRWADRPAKEGHTSVSREGKRVTQDSSQGVSAAVGHKRALTNGHSSWRAAVERLSHASGGASFDGSSRVDLAARAAQAGSDTVEHHHINADAGALPFHHAGN